MEIESEDRDGWNVVSVSGEVDIRTAPELRECLTALLEAGSERLILDLDGVDFLDSTALSVMVGAHKRLARNGAGLHLVCTKEAVLRVLGVTGLARIFTVHDSLDDALSGAEPDGSSP